MVSNYKATYFPNHEFISRKCLFFFWPFRSPSQPKRWRTVKKLTQEALIGQGQLSWKEKDERNNERKRRRKSVKSGFLTDNGVAFRQGFRALCSYQQHCSVKGKSAKPVKGWKRYYHLKNSTLATIMKIGDTLTYWLDSYIIMCMSRAFTIIIEVWFSCGYCATVVELQFRK